MRKLPPGSRIGILGGGQLGRMTALAAFRLGYSCHVFCQKETEPAALVTPYRTVAPFDDREALAVFADQVDVVTLEWENVPLESLAFLEARKPVCPGSAALRVAQDRVLEKIFAREQGIGTADFSVVHSAEGLEKALEGFVRPCILKSTRMGYDGHGQVRLTPEISAAEAWQRMNAPVGILESFVDFACEVSVIVARRADGAAAAYPVVENRHENQILAETLYPASVSPEIAAEAEAAALKLAHSLKVVGLLAVEMFVLKQPNAKGQRVLMNEIAPRPHNSGHWTIDACACSQFEQLIRAICGLPFGSVHPHSHARMQNLLGEAILQQEALLEDPSACVHNYGKQEIRAGRKMGHVTFLGGRS